MNRTFINSLSGAVLVASSAATIGTLIVGPGGIAALGAMVTWFFVAIGVYLVIRTGGNVVGWLLAGFGLSLSITTFGEVYAAAGRPSATWVAWLVSLTWLPGILALLVGIPLTFPNGRLPTGRWRWVVWTTVVGCVLFWAGNAFSSELLDDYGLTNPLERDVSQLITDIDLVMAVLLLAVSIVVAMVSVVIRYRRSAGLERQQMKWFVSAALVLVPALIINGWLYETGRAEIGRVIVMAAALGVAVAIAIAVLRYRLYDLDRVLSRTVTYAVVVAALGGVFAVGVVLVPNATIRSRETPMLLVAASTLAVAALFNPLRRRVQRWVDHQFNRSRYDVAMIMDEFSDSLRDLVDVDSVVGGWVGVVSRTMQPTGIGIWVKG